MAKVSRYRVLDSGTPDGHQSNRAQIEILKGSTVLGWIKFHDPGMPFAGDTQAGGKITMHLPSAMFEDVIDVLRNEEPVYFYFASGHAFLGTLREPVGEGEETRPEHPDAPSDLPVTRPPIFVEWRAYNYFTVWKHSPAFFEQALTAYPPVVLWSEGGFGGHVENPFQWGAVKGVVHAGEPDAEVYGNETKAWIDDIFDAGLADPDMLAQRFAELSTYLAEYEGITRPAPYADLGTQVFGNRLTRTAFWSFYDRWDEYALPTPDRPQAHGQFDLGPRPPDPETWLRRWHDPNNSQVCQVPDDPNCQGLEDEVLQNYKGLTFPYAPRNTLDHSVYFRFSVCLNTEGWALWWKQIMRWLARVGFHVAFIDNSWFSNCWNEECQEGYRAWLSERYSAAEVDRFFTVTTSLLYDHSFEYRWFQLFNETGPWGLPYAFADGGKIFPDGDSYDGLYSVRLEGPGRLQLYPYPQPPEELPLEDKDNSLTIHYKTDADIGASLHVSQVSSGALEIVNEPLTQSADWTALTVRFHIPANMQLQVSFKVERPGNLWVDALWLSRVTVRDGEEVLDHPTFKKELWSATNNLGQFSELLREWAAGAYWGSVVDEKLAYLRNVAREIDPGFQLFTNSSFQRRGSDYFLLEGQALEFEGERQDTGYPPGVYLPAPEGQEPRVLRGREVTSEVLNTNVFDYKYSYSRRRTDSFAYHIHTAVSTQGTDAAGQQIVHYPHNRDSAMLVHAEAAAFGAGAGIDMQLRMHYYAYSDEEKAELQGLSRDFFEFVHEHRFAYEGLRSYGEVGLIYHGIRPDNRYHNEVFDLALGLASHGVLWDLLTEKRCTAVNFARYKVLICHAVERISETVAQELIEFMEGGGLVIASGNEAGSVDEQQVFTRFYVGRLDEFFRMRAAKPGTVWPPVRLSGATTEAHEIGMGRLISVPAGGLNVEQMIQQIEGFFADKGTSRQLGVFVNLPPTALERMRAAAWAAPDRLALHLVNYNVPLRKENRNQVEALTNVGVEATLPEGLSPSSVRLLTPEASAASGEIPFSVSPDRAIRFVIPRLHIYEIALIQ